MITKIIDLPFSLQESQYQGANAGGVMKDVRVCPADWIEDFEVKTDGSLVVDEIRLKAGRSWMLICGVHGKASWTVQNSMNDHGRLYNHVFGIEVAKIKPSLLEWLHNFGEVPLVMMFADRNGFGRLLGTVEQPVFFDFSAATGTNTGKNSISITGRCQTTDNLGYFVKTIDDALAMIASMAEIAQFRSELNDLLDRVEMLEDMSVNGAKFKVFTYVFDDLGGGHILNLLDGFVVDAGKSVMLMAVSLNGVSMSGRVGTGPVFGHDFDDLVVVRGVQPKVYFNDNTVSLVNNNILKMLVKIG